MGARRASHRLEQIYPLFEEERSTSCRRTDAAGVLGAEGLAPGSLGLLRHHWATGLCGRCRFGRDRPESSSPATGSAASHKRSSRTCWNARLKAG